MNTYLQSLLGMLNSIPAPGMEGRVAPQRTQMQQPAQQAPAQSAPPQAVPQQGPGFGMGQPAQDPMAQQIMQTPNPNMPPSLPQNEADAVGQPSSPGNPGYIGPFAEPQQPQAASKPKVTLKLTPELLEMLAGKKGSK